MGKREGNNNNEKPSVWRYGSGRGLARVFFKKKEAGPSSILDFYNRFVWESGLAVHPVGIIEIC